MALRTIADLPELDIQSVLKQPDGPDKLADSLFEISYMEEYGGYNTYKSKHIKYHSLSSSLLENISNNEFDFYGHKIFYGGVSISNGLDLSGNFLINAGVDDFSQFSAIINAGDVQINSNNTELCSQNFTVYTNNGQFKTYDGQFTIATWNENRFSFNTQVYLEKIECQEITATNKAVINGNLSVDGEATFKQVINGCALCAKWADLAELYRSDADYKPGTLVRFGGDAEITIASEGCANAVITDTPGLILNGTGSTDGIYKGIALVGRTPVLAVGPVRRFDKLALDPMRPGTAYRAQDNDNIIAVSLGELQEGESGTVECAVQLRL